MELCNEGHETNLKHFTFLFSTLVSFAFRYLINLESEAVGGEETRLGGLLQSFSDPRSKANYACCKLEIENQVHNPDPLRQQCTTMPPTTLSYQVYNRRKQIPREESREPSNRC